MPYTPLPPVPQRNQPVTFADDGDAFLAALPQFGAEMEAARLAAVDAIAAAPIAVAAANYRGDYSAVVTYQVGQSVSYSGARWLAKTVNLAVTPTDGANWGLIREIPNPLGNGAKVLKSSGASFSWQPLLPVEYRVAQYTASATFTVPADTYVIRPYAFGKGGDSTTTSSGGGGGCAYGDIAVTPGDSVTLSISAGVAKVTLGGVDLLTANPASGATAGTASKHASVANGGAYSGGTGAGSKGSGASSGSPLGIGVNGVATTNAGGSGWGAAGAATGGGGVGTAPIVSVRAGDGLPLPSIEPLFAGLSGLGGAFLGIAGPGLPGQPGGGGSSPNGSYPGGQGGFGAGGGGAGVSTAADGGFGAGGGASNSGGGGKGGLGGGGAGSGSAAVTGGAAVIRIYY